MRKFNKIKVYIKRKKYPGHKKIYIKIRNGMCVMINLIKKIVKTV